MLGAMLQTAEARAGALEMLAPDDFEREGHRTLFGVLAGMHQNGTHVDNITVNDKLARPGKLDEVGTLASVWQLTSIEGCPVPAAWPTYANVVKREGLRRRDLARLRRAISRLEAGEDPTVVASELAVVS